MKTTLWTLAVMGALALGGWSVTQADDGGGGDLPPCYPCCPACK